MTLLMRSGGIHHGIVDAGGHAERLTGSNVVNSNDDYADLTPGETYLTSTRGYGETRMLWKAAGTGQKWAVVQLGHRVGAVAWGKLIESSGPLPLCYQADGTAWTKSDGYPVYAAVNPCSPDGLNPVTSVTPVSYTHLTLPTN